MSFNKAIIHGNLGRNPELRYTQSQKPVCTFSVATTEKYNDEEQTTWHNIVVWGKIAERCSEFLSKGSSVLVEGKITTRKWEDQNGQTRYTTEIVASNVQFTSKASGHGDANQGTKRENDPGLDNIPF